MALTKPELDQIKLLLVANNKELVTEMKDVFVEQKVAYKWAAGNLIAFILFFLQMIYQKLPHA